MAPEKTNRISGELLRNLREAQSMDITRLARQVNLSVAQLRQLESDQLAPGERPLFYSETIRTNAAKKVALALGADLNELLIAPQASEEASLNGLPDMQVLDDLAHLLQKQERARQASRSHAFLQSRRMWATVMMFIAGAFVWNFQKPLLAQGRDWVAAINRPSLAAAPALEPASETASEPVVAASPAVASEPKPIPSSAEALCARKPSGEALKASTPSKAGKSVYIVANDDVSVCVQDATGQKFPVTMKAQESRSFYGEAPWVVHFDKATSLQLFFQGQRLRWPEDQQTSFTLQEVPGTY